jgi:hypothetical protein
MKRFIMTIAAALMITASASAMSYSEARSEAQYLTDKMAYELGLDDEQYAEAYQINLAYLQGVDDYDDIYANVWNIRNRAFRTLFSYNQWTRFIGANYFYRPLEWRNGDFYLNVYNRYPQRDMAMNRMGNRRSMEYGNMRRTNDDRGYGMEYGENRNMNGNHGMGYNNGRNMNEERNMNNDRYMNENRNMNNNRDMSFNNDRNENDNRGMSMGNNTQRQNNDRSMSFGNGNRSFSNNGNGMSNSRMQSNETQMNGHFGGGRR